MAQKDLLEEFELNSTLPFKDICSADYSFQASADRTTVTLTVPNFSIDNKVLVPEKATHFRLINLIGVLSSYRYNIEEKGYTPLDKVNDGKNSLAVSDYLPITGNSGALSIVANLNGVTALNPASAVVAAIGIQFFENRALNYYPKSANGVTKIVQIF